MKEKGKKGKEHREKRQEERPPDLGKSKRALDALSGTLGLDALGEIAGILHDEANVRAEKDEKTTFSATTDEVFGPAREKQFLESGATVEDLAELQRVVASRKGTLPEGFDLDVFNKTINAKKSDLATHLAEKKAREAEQEMIDQAEARRRSHTRKVVGIAVAGVVGVTATTVGIVNYVHNKDVQYEQTHQLQDYPSAASYTGWRIAAVSGDRTFAEAGPPQLIDKEETIKVGEEDAQIELYGYETTKDVATAQAVINGEDPYNLGIEWDILRKESYSSQEVLLPKVPTVVELFGPQPGQTVYLKIDDVTPEKTGDDKFTYTPLSEIPKTQT